MVAWNAYGQSKTVYSNAVTVVTAPAASTDPTAASGQSITIRATAIADSLCNGTSLTIYNQGAAPQSTTCATSPCVFTYKFTGLSPGTNYSYYTSATDGCGNSVQTSTHTYTPINITCPEATTATAGTQYGGVFLAAGDGGSLSISSSTPSWLSLPGYIDSYVEAYISSHPGYVGIPSSIVGTPPSAGSYTYSVTATDSTGDTATQSCPLTVSAAPISITCPTATTATVDTPYTGTFGASGSGAGYSWSMTGLPPGLSLVYQSGTMAVIGNTPTSAGSYNYTATVNSGSNSGSKNCSITVYNPIIITCGASAGLNDFVNTYSGTVDYVSGGSGAGYSWTITGLPPGWSMGSEAGNFSEIGGTPTIAGSYNYTATVTDSAGHSATKICPTITIHSPLTITCLSNSYSGPCIDDPVTGDEFCARSPVVGIPYTATLVSASGGSGIYYWGDFDGLPLNATTFTLPEGLENGVGPTDAPPHTAVVTGTPESVSPGAFNPDGTFTATVEDSFYEVATQNCPINVSLPMTITCPSHFATWGVPFSETITASGGTGAYQMWPYAMMSDWSSGTVQWPPNCGLLPGDSGLCDYTYSGLTLQPCQGAACSQVVLSGTPTGAGTYYFPIYAYDSDLNSYTVDKSCNLTIQCPTIPITITTASLPTLSMTDAYYYDNTYTASLSATGGCPMEGNYTWTDVSGSLAASNLVLSPNGVISSTASEFNCGVDCIETSSNPRRYDLNVTVIASTPYSSSAAKTLDLGVAD